MGTHSLCLPQGYYPLQGILDTERAIKTVKDSFERTLAKNLHLTRVSAPLFVTGGSGLNDNLSGTERPVSFDVPACGEELQIVHSLAKWKRQALKRYGFGADTGLYTDMNAIRRDEEHLDNLHSVYVDQWDWEKIITREMRNMDMLQDTVERIVTALKESEYMLNDRFPQIKPFIKGSVTFVTSQELEDRWPELTPREREDAVCREHQTVFISQIGGRLKSGVPHDKRAPDYDDWSLNGDLLVWYPVLERAVELSSMGIRVDEQSMAEQLRLSGCEDRRELPFHKALLAGELPLTMGGGIGQSRVSMILLGKAHVGEVQVSLWDDETMKICEEVGVMLL